MSIPYEWLWAAYAVIALVVAGLLYAAWRFFRRKTAAKAKLPYEIALEKLEAARALMTVETVREYAFTVSEIIRVYIEQRFGEKAARRTTEEFLSDLLAANGHAARATSRAARRFFEPLRPDQICPLGRKRARDRIDARKRPRLHSRYAPAA